MKGCRSSIRVGIVTPRTAHNLLLLCCDLSKKVQSCFLLLLLPYPPFFSFPIENCWMCRYGTHKVNFSSVLYCVFCLNIGDGGFTLWDPWLWFFDLRHHYTEIGIIINIDIISEWVRAPIAAVRTHTHTHKDKRGLGRLWLWLLGWRFLVVRTRSRVWERRMRTFNCPRSKELTKKQRGSSRPFPPWEREEIRSLLAL